LVENTTFEIYKGNQTQNK